MFVKILEKSHVMSALVTVLVILVLIINFAVIEHRPKQQRTHDKSRPQTAFNSSRSFIIDYANNVFSKDGKPFYYISGELHYYRVPRQYWRDRLWKYKAAGLNVISTYIEWSWHEPTPGNYRFSGDQEVEYFIQLVIDEGFLMIIRPGPFICAERDLGGMPAWLQSLYPDIKLRTNDKNYQKEVKKWFDELFKRIKKYLYKNGGPIITVQVENEYGIYGEDMAYKIWIRDEIRRHVGEDVVLTTVDPSVPYDLKRGAIPGVYATVDFGVYVNITKAFSNMREVSSRGPMINSEFYPGWISSWQSYRGTVKTSDFTKSMKQLLDLKANFNIYLLCGGTNFGFTNGAYDFNDNYEPVVTSYDFDAPLTEAGDPTSKYYAIRDLISQYQKLPDIPAPTPTPKGKYGKVQMTPILSIFNTSCIEDKITATSDLPQSFEKLNIFYGYILYETRIPAKDLFDPALLYAPYVRDRAIVCVDQKPVGILSRMGHVFSIPLIAPAGKTLSLLVENQGRSSFGGTDFKGLLSAPTLNNHTLVGWNMTGLPFRDITWTYELPLRTEACKISPPAFYIGELVLPLKQKPLDTFVDLTGWGKYTREINKFCYFSIPFISLIILLFQGIIFVNNINIGRYWPSTGPQVTLYVPGCYLLVAPQKNKIVVFETEYAPDNHQILFTDTPNLEKPPPSVK